MGSATIRTTRTVCEAGSPYENFGMMSCEYYPQNDYTTKRKGFPGNSSWRPARMIHPQFLGDRAVHLRLKAPAKDGTLVALILKFISSCLNAFATVQFPVPC